MTVVAALLLFFKSIVLPSRFPHSSHLLLAPLRFSGGSRIGVVLLDWYFLKYHTSHPFECHEHLVISGPVSKTNDFRHRIGRQ